MVRSIAFAAAAALFATFSMRVEARETEIGEVVFGTPVGVFRLVVSYDDEDEKLIKKGYWNDKHVDTHTTSKPKRKNGRLCWSEEQTFGIDASDGLLKELLGFDLDSILNRSGIGSPRAGYRIDAAIDPQNLGNSGFQAQVGWGTSRKMKWEEVATHNWTSENRIAAGDGDDDESRLIHRLVLIGDGDDGDLTRHVFWLNPSTGRPHYFKERGAKVWVRDPRAMTDYKGRLYIIGDGPEAGKSYIFWLNTRNGRPHYVKENGNKVTIADARAMTVFDDRLYILGDGPQPGVSHVFWLKVDSGTLHYVEERGRRVTVDDPRAMTTFENRLFILGDGPEPGKSHVFFLNTDNGKPHYIRENDKKVVVANGRAMTVFDNKLFILGDGTAPENSHVFFLDTDDGEPHYVRADRRKVSIADARAIAAYENKLFLLGNGPERGKSHVFHLNLENGEPKNVEERGSPVTVADGRAMALCAVVPD